MNFEGNDNMDDERYSVSSDNELVISAIYTAAFNIVGYLTFSFNFLVRWCKMNVYL